MERLDETTVRVTGEHVALTLTFGELSDCTHELGGVEAPELMPEAKVEERPVWLALQGDGEAASLRLSTRGALLVVDDGCLRVADVTSSLLGTATSDDDVLFSRDSVAPESASDASDLDLRRRGSTSAAIVRNRDTLIEASYFSGYPLLQARALDEARWIRFAVSRAYEYTDNDGEIGREHTLEWSVPTASEAPKLVLDNDYRYGSNGRDRFETDLRSRRIQRHSDGTLQTVARRTVIEDVLRRIPHRCEEVSRRLVVSRHDESVRWMFEARDGKKRTLGTATLNAVFASHCVDYAAKRFARERLDFTVRAPRKRMTWRLSSRG